MVHHLHTPLTDAAIGALRAGDPVLVTGVVYAARDAAHRRLVAALENGEPLPFDPRDKSSTTWALPRPGPAGPSDPPAPRPPIAWTPIPPACWSKA